MASDGQSDAGMLELPRRRIVAIVATLMLGNLLAVIDTTVIAVALPVISAEFDNLTDQAWIVVGYMLASTAMVPIYGKLSDLYGRKNVYQAAIVVFLVGSLLCGISQTMAQLIGARVLKGMGAGGLMVSSLAIIGEVVSPRHRARYQAYFTMIASAGIIAGPAVGGVLVDALSWRWIFLIPVPIGLVALVVIAFVLEPGRRQPGARVDYLGSVLFVGAVVALLMAMVWGGQRHPWGSSTIIGLLVTSAVLATAFVLQQRRAPHALIPGPLVRQPAVAVSAAYAFLVSVTVFGATIIPIQQFIQVVVGAPASDVWRYMTGFAVLNIVAAMLVGRLISRVGSYKRFLLLSSLGVLATVVLMGTMDVDTPGVLVAVYLGVLGLSMGLGAVVPVLAAQNAVERDDLGAASGLVNFFQQLGGSVGTAIFGTVFALRLAPRLDQLVEGDVLVREGISSPDAIRELGEAARRAVQEAYAASVQGVYGWTILTALAAVGAALALRETPLRTWSYAARDLEEDTVPATDPAAPPAPETTSS